MNAFSNAVIVLFPLTIVACILAILLYAPTILLDCFDHAD